MKIEKFGENKLKVTLTQNDMTSYDIGEDAIRPDSPTLLKFIGTLLDRAREETGFCADSGGVTVEASKQNSNFVFLITSISCEKKENGNPKKPGGRKFHVVKKGVLVKKPEMNTYKFDSLENFANFLKSAGNFPPVGTLYKNNDAYYLTISKSTDDALSLGYILSEFSVKIDSKLISMYLGEHCRRIASGKSFNLLKNCF